MTWRREGERGQAELRDGCSESMTDVGDEPFTAGPVLEIERGTVLAGRYQIEAVIGKGGSGVVLRAFDRIAQSPVAVKILKSELAADPHWVERFSRELRLARQIQHPNVCRVFDIGEADGHRFLTMELAGEGTLRAAVRFDAAPRPLEARVADARAMASGMAAIHAAGIVHRDVKPENLLRMDDGRLVVSDFGLATNPTQAAAVTLMVGTPSYMAPEIVMGDPAAMRSDVWAIGVVMHEILFAKRPEWEVTPRERIFRPPVGKEASHALRELARLCGDCARENPAGRPADAVEVLRRFVEAESAARVNLPRRVWRSRRRWGWAPIAASAALAVIATKDRWTAASATSSRGPAAAVAVAVRDVKPTGSPRDWSAASELVTRIEGRVHCFSVLPDGTTARVVWGTPRRAEDIEIATGRRTPSPLRPETFQHGCPRQAPRGQGLLFDSSDSGTSAQIMYSQAPNGEGARALTKGSDAIWLATGREFVFNLDGSHAALFSLPTMSFDLILDGAIMSKRVINEKTVNDAGDAVAILYTDENDELGRTLATHSLPDLELKGRFRLPASTKAIMFGKDSDELLFSFDYSLAHSGLAALDLRLGSARDIGFVPRYDIRDVSTVGRETVFVTRRLSSDVWLFDRAGKAERITFDGQSYSSTNSGDVVLVGGRGSDGRYSIVRYDQRGGQAGVRLTSGPKDVMPTFAPDGRTWYFVKYDTNAIVRCQLGGDDCREIHADPLMPTWPSCSPDGKLIAYVTIMNTSRLRVVPTDGGKQIDLGPALTDCAPIWTSATNLWSYQIAGADRGWVEIDVRTGEKTGRSLPVDRASYDGDACARETRRPESPLFQRTQVVSNELSELRRLLPASRRN
jgi:serine/threonine protein kinase